MEPVETDGGLQVTGAETEPSEHAVVAPLKQLFTGLRVGLPSLTVRCCVCGIELEEGDTVSVYPTGPSKRRGGISLAVGAQIVQRRTSQR